MTWTVSKSDEAPLEGHVHFVATSDEPHRVHYYAPTQEAEESNGMATVEARLLMAAADAEAGAAALAIGGLARVHLNETTYEGMVVSIATRFDPGKRTFRIIVEQEV